MKKHISFAKTAVLTALMLGAPALLFAADFRTGDQVSVKSDESVAEDFYAAGGTVTSAGTVTGDLYAGGGTVLVTGNVSQDVVALGGTVSVLGNVGDDVRIMGGTIIVQGTVAGDVVIGGGQIHLTGTRVGGDVLIGGGSVRVDTPVVGDVKIGGGDVYLNAEVQGNVEVHAEKLTLGSEAVVTGNLKYRSPKEAVMEEGASVLGTTTYDPAPEGGRGAILAAFFSAFALLKLFMLLVGGFFFGLLLQRFSQSVVETAHARPLVEIGRGFVLLVVMPIVSVLLLVTVVGVPLGLLGLFSYMAFVIVGSIMAPLILGSAIYRRYTKNELEVTWKTILIGVVVFFLVGIVPILGGVAQFALILLALGSMANVKWSILKEWR